MSSREEEKLKSFNALMLKRDILAAKTEISTIISDLETLKTKQDHVINEFYRNKGNLVLRDKLRCKRVLIKQKISAKLAKRESLQQELLFLQDPHQTLQRYDPNTILEQYPYYLGLRNIVIVEPSDWRRNEETSLSQSHSSSGFL